MADKQCPVLSRFDVVKSVLESADWTVEHHFRASRLTMGPTILDLDDSRHAGGKRVLSRLLVEAGRTEFRRAVIRPIVRGAWETFTRSGGDVISGFAMRVPPEVIFRILGLPPSRARDLYERDIRPIAKFIGDNTTGHDAAQAAGERLRAFLAECEAGRIVDADPAIIRSVIRAYADERMGHDDAVGAITLLLAAGTETTIGAIANVFFFIAEYPRSWAELQAGELSIRAFVQEVLRFEAPLQRTVRFAKRDTVVGPGIAVARGSAVELCLSQANRNQEGVHAPDEWAPAEDRGTGATFGLGRHACIGKALAIAEMSEVAALLRDTAFDPSCISEREPLRGDTFRRSDRIVIRVAST